jgi:hypothetical protein
MILHAAIYCTLVAWEKKSNAGRKPIEPADADPAEVARQIAAQ